MSHYYSPDPNLPHQTRTIEYAAGKKRLVFLTDSGVFSRQKVDYGSNILIQALPPLQGNLLDLGCGYGPIGISLAAINPQCQVTMVDINKRAVALAQENIRTNKLANARVLESDGFSAVLDKYNTIVCNPPIRTGKKVIYPLFEQSIDYIIPGGTLWLVIQKKQGAESALAKLISVFGNCSAVEKSGGYWVLRSNKE